MIGRAGLGLMTQAAGSAIWGNPYAKRATIGAGLGAVYGATMGDSTWGGMWKGAAMGLGSAYGSRLMNAPRVMRAGRDMGFFGSVGAVGKAMGATIYSDLYRTQRFLRNNARRAYNPIQSTLKGLFNR